MEVELIGEVKAKYLPNQDVRKECLDLGKLVAEKVLSIVK